MLINSRPYQGEADYQRIRNFLIETYGITKTHHNWCLVRWDLWRYSNNARAELNGDRRWGADIRLWESEAGKLVGVAHREDQGNAFLQIHPEYRYLEDEMVAWAERQLAVPTEDGKRRQLNLWVYDYDTERQSMLARRGYQKLERVGYKRCRDMGKPLPEVTVPEGYTVRALRVDDDLALRCTVLGKAFGSPIVSTDVYHVLQTAPGYHLNLDLVAVAPDGTFASFCIVWFDEVNAIGTFEPVGTHPNHRQLGLDKAVMCEGLKRLETLGATLAYVGAGDAVPANRLYESVGFTEFDIEHLWQKRFTST